MRIGLSLHVTPAYATHVVFAPCEKATSKPVRQVILQPPYISTFFVGADTNTLVVPYETRGSMRGLHRSVGM